MVVVVVVVVGTWPRVCLCCPSSGRVTEPLASSFLVKKRGETGVTATAKHNKVWRSMNRTYPWGIRIAAKRFS